MRLGRGRPIHRGHHERERLARARLRLGDDVSAGSNSIVDLSASQGVYSTALSGVAPDSISETFNTSVGTDLTTITFLDGGIGDWTIL